MMMLQFLSLKLRRHACRLTFSQSSGFHAAFQASLIFFQEAGKLVKKKKKNPQFYYASLILFFHLENYLRQCRLGGFEYLL